MTIADQIKRSGNEHTARRVAARKRGLYYLPPRNLTKTIQWMWKR